MTPVAGPGDDRAGQLSAAEAEALLAPVAAAPSIAIAVSGGGDSLALLDTVDRWRKAPGRPAVTVLTVDHGLVAGSGAVAAGVAAAAAERGLAARVLAWEGAKPTSGIEAAARQARYRLLAAAARDAGATHLLTAHSLEDQAETFLMRLARGSGVFGLGGMRRAIDLGGLVLFRPFLGVPRARLAATARAAGVPPHDDPMNADTRFQRVRVRRLLPGLAEAGIDAGTIAAAAARLAAAADAIDRAVDALVRDAVTIDRFAVATIALEALAAAPAEVRFRLLVRLLQAIGGADYPPRTGQAEALLAALLGPGDARRTLWGVVAERQAGTIRLLRETGRAELPAVAAPPGRSLTWDHRFRLAVATHAPPGLTIAAVGGARPAGMVRPKDLRAAALAALPAVFSMGRILAVPSLGWRAPSGPAADTITVAETVSERLAAPPRFPATDMS